MICPHCGKEIEANPWPCNHVWRVIGKGVKDTKDVFQCICCSIVTIDPPLLQSYVFMGKTEG